MCFEIFMNGQINMVKTTTIGCIKRFQNVSMPENIETAEDETTSVPVHNEQVRLHHDYEIKWLISLYSLLVMTIFFNIAVVRF